MPGRAIVGQVAAVAGSGLLLIFVPFMPSVWGLPRGRVLEMCVFWIGSCLLLFGLEASRAAFIQSCRSGIQSPAARRIGVYSVASVVFGMASGLVTLSMLLFTSFVGAGLLADDSLVSHMPGPLRWMVALPLLPIFLCQGLSLAMLRLPAPEKQLVAARPARTMLLALLFLVSVLFAGALLLFLANRWFALFAVVATWFAQWLFIALAIEQTASLTRELR